MHAIVLVSKIHKPTLRAVNYARASRPSTIEALTVDVDPDETEALAAEWDRRHIPVPLKVLDSPYREITRPIIDYVKDIRRQSPRDVVTVYIPEYVVGHWWEHLLHNQSALRLKGRLLFTPGVMVTSVPWQLTSSEAPSAGTPRTAARRGGRPPAGGRPGSSDGPAAHAGRGRAPSSSWRRPVAHGGHCVARHEGRVVFVRHTLPGERVRAVVTARTSRSSCAPTPSRCSCAAAGRVAPPCPYAGPGRLRWLRLAARRPGRPSAR